jgi:hypothetical protein
MGSKKTGLRSTAQRPRAEAFMKWTRGCGTKVISTGGGEKVMALSVIIIGVAVFATGFGAGYFARAMISRRRRRRASMWGSPVWSGPARLTVQPIETDGFGPLGDAGLPLVAIRPDIELGEEHEQMGRQRARQLVPAAKFLPDRRLDGAHPQRLVQAVMFAEFGEVQPLLRHFDKSGAKGQIRNVARQGQALGRQTPPLSRPITRHRRYAVLPTDNGPGGEMFRGRDRIAGQRVEMQRQKIKERQREAMAPAAYGK